MNVNVGRVLVGGRNNQSQAEISRGIAQHGTAPILQRAVVMDVVTDIDGISDEVKSQLKDSVTNPEFVDNMPTNSIIARVVADGQDNLGGLASVFYPVFQSHMLLPIQAGEHVWVMYDDYSRSGSSGGRWLTRVHENSAVEDINFTHADRRFNPSLNQSLERTSQQADRNQQNTQQSNRPAFPNGGGTVDSYTLAVSGSVNPYDNIYQNSEASKLHSYEAVPRWTKRPQEFVLQGMNNSLICLGQDRKGLFKSQGEPGDKKNSAGSIDVVCGRGRYPLAPSDATATAGKDTSPIVTENSRGKLETDKTPFQRRRRKNPREGDPNFKTDAARVLVSMNTDGDKNFNIVDSADSANGIRYPSNTLKPTQPTAPNESIGNSYVIGKADHIRLIARTENIPNPPGGKVDGTILLIKEGAEDNGLAYFYIDKDGRIQIDAKKVYLGQAVTGDPNGDNHNEPYIKWSVYNQHINELKAQITEISNHLKSLVTAYQAAFATSFAIPMVPIASLNAVGTTTVATTEAVTTAIRAKLDTIRPEDAKSTKIFGE